jgi:hypothetical protein
MHACKREIGGKLLEDFLRGVDEKIPPEQDLNFPVQIN